MSEGELAKLNPPRYVGFRPNVLKMMAAAGATLPGSPFERLEASRKG